MDFDTWRKSQNPVKTYSTLAKDLNLHEKAIYRIIKFGCKNLKIANQIVTYTSGEVTHEALETVNEH